MVDGRPHAIGIRQKTLQTSLLSKNYIFNLENDLLEQKFFLQQQYLWQHLVQKFVLDVA